MKFWTSSLRAPLVGLTILLAAGTTARSEAPPPTGPVWVMRHGEDAGPERALTERGKEQAAEAAATFRGVERLTIWTSPRLRTRETAAIVHARTPGSTLTVVDWLDHTQPFPANWWERLPAGPVLLVTHQPVVARILRDRNRPSAGIGHAFVARLDDPSP